MKGIEQLEHIKHLSEWEYYDIKDDIPVIEQVFKTFSFIIDKLCLGVNTINSLNLYYLALYMPHHSNGMSVSKVFITKEQYEELLKLGIKEIKG